MASSAGTPFRRFNPARVFPLIGLVVGILTALLTPPFQVPDEQVHFLRAYQIAQGQFVPTWENGQAGAVLPTSIVLTISRFADVRFNRSATSFAAIANTARDVPLNPKARSHYFLYNGHYSPLAFVPQALAIAVGRMLQWPPVILLYLARLANLFCFIALVYVALRMAGALARPLFLLALMPMSLFMAASASPDAMTNALAFLLAAMVAGAISCESASDDRPLTRTWIAAFILVSAALCIFKVAYFPLTALLLLIPSRRFGGWRRLALLFAVLGVFCLAPTMLWQRLCTPGLDIVFDPGNPFLSMRRQLNFLENHPSALLKIPIYSARRDGWLVVLSFVGKLGWMNVQLAPIFCFAYLLALLLACRPDENSRRFPRFAVLAAVTLAIIAATVEATLLMIDLIWTSVSGLQVDGLQGRYFLPIAPVGLLFLAGAWRYFSRRLPPAAPENRRDLAAAAVAAASSIYMLIVIYFHYYVSIAFCAG